MILSASPDVEHFRPPSMFAEIVHPMGNHVSNVFLFCSTAWKGLVHC